MGNNCNSVAITSEDKISIQIETGSGGALQMLSVRPSMSGLQVMRLITPPLGKRVTHLWFELPQPGSKRLNDNKSIASQGVVEGSVLKISLEDDFTSASGTYRYHHEHTMPGHEYGWDERKIELELDSTGKFRGTLLIVWTPSSVDKKEYCGFWRQEGPKLLLEGLMKESTQDGPTWTEKALVLQKMQGHMSGMTGEFIIKWEEELRKNARKIEDQSPGPWG